VDADDFDNGWDTRATLVDGRWVDRTPRRPEVEPQVRREVALLPWLAPQVPLAVPTPWVVSESPLTVRHALVVGDECPGTAAEHGRAVGSFLRALHTVDPGEAVRRGARDAATTFAEAQAIRDRMAGDVLPRLPAHVSEAGEALLARMSVPPPETCFVHGDLGPDHIRVVGAAVSGIIDWGDSGVGDPGIDLAWTMLGAGPDFAAALETAYGPDERLASRAVDWHLLGPWHEVIYGLDTDEPAYVASGLSGVVARLERFALDSS
jgi:aminoglycoside phosphotransferase (APT) family kinase protein